MSVFWIVLALLVLPIPVGALIHHLLKRARQRQHLEFLEELKKSRTPLIEAAFLDSYGRSLMEPEKDFVRRLRLILARAARIEPELIHPHDQVLSLFGSKLNRRDALARTVAEMDGLPEAAPLSSATQPGQCSAATTASGRLRTDCGSAVPSLLRDYALDLKRAGNFERQTLSVAEFADSLLEASTFRAGGGPEDNSSPEAFGREFNIRREHQPAIRPVLEALAKCVGLEAEAFTIYTTAGDLKKVAPQGVKPEVLLERLSEKGLADGPPQEETRAAEVRSGPGSGLKRPEPSVFAAPDARYSKVDQSFLFPRLGDWLYWLIYVYARRSRLLCFIGCESESLSAPTPNPQPDLDQLFGENFYDYLGARAFNIQPRHLPLMLAVRKTLAGTMRRKERALAFKLPVSKLVTMLDEYLDPVEFTMDLEENLGVGLDEYAFSQNPLDFSRYLDAKRPQLFYCLGDWLHWYIYTYLRESMVSVHLDGQWSRVKISGRSYLDSWELSPFGRGWSRFNDSGTDGAER